MNFELVYDVATTSEAPRSALLLGLAATAILAVWYGWLKLRGLPIGNGTKFLGVVALLLLLLSLGTWYEQRRLADRRDTRNAEGPVVSHWTKRVRRPGNTISYWEWEGFSIQGVAFAYARNLEQNYFHNAGKSSIDLRDGMHLKLRYIEERDGDQIRNQILRVERAVE